MSEALPVSVHVQRSDDNSRPRSLLRDLAGSFREPGFWALSSWLDIVVRARESRMGPFWLLLPPALYIFGMGSFFSSMNKVPVAKFAAHVALGWCLFRVVTTVITESANAFSGSAAFILDGHTRLTDFVLRLLAKALFNLLMALPVLALALALYPDLSWRGLVLFLLTFPLLVANTLWIGVVFSLLGARFRDVGQFVGSVFMFAFVLTPIIWYASTMPAGTIRGQFMRLNPFFHMIEIVRAPILGEPIEIGTVYFMAGMTVIGWLLAIALYRRYARFVPLWI